MSPPTPCLSRIARTSLHRTQWRRVLSRQYSSTAANDPPWFQELRSEMLSRSATTSEEYIVDTTEHKLTDTLSTFLPADWLPRVDASNVPIPMGHHLVWFNTSMPVDQLLPDGTDPLQSPGAPWVRRMWAGGSLQLKPDLYYRAEKGFAANTTMVCAERIQDVQLRGQDEAAKIFVTIERRFARLDTLMTGHEKPLAVISKDLARRRGPHQQFRRQLEAQEWGDAVLKEYRNLVFLKERTPAELDAIKTGQSAPLKYMKSPGEPDFAHKLTPTRSLLFRYSALTFNAHLIHLDKDYARNVEGHRNLLVHGPLSLTLMLQALAGHVKAHTSGRHVLESIEYRNLVPLYCDEEMRICGMEKKSSTDGGVYEVWIEGPTGGVAVKGTVYTAVQGEEASSKPPPVVQEAIGFRLHYVNGQDSSLTSELHEVNTRSREARKFARKQKDAVIPSRNAKIAERKQKDRGPAMSGASTLVRRTAFRSVIVPTSDPSSRRSSKTGRVKTEQAMTKPHTRHTLRFAKRPHLSAFKLPSLPDAEPDEQSLSTDVALDTSLESRSAPALREQITHRRERLARMLEARTRSSTGLMWSLRRIQAAPEPAKTSVPLRARHILHRASRRAQQPYSIEPIPVVRTYRGKTYTYDPAAVASRHSRYSREGARLIQQTYLRYLRG